jgi:hypothetical protein
MDWFMSQIKSGSFKVINPYNQKVRHVPASADKVHTLAFWSKNFGPFLAGGYRSILVDIGYHLFFNFTINSESSLLEPHVPGLAERFDQLERLADQVDPRSITWRFDPICFFMHRGTVYNNLNAFRKIAAKASACGIRRCITSFMDDYGKIRKRAATIDSFAFIEPPMHQKVGILLEMEQILAHYTIQLTLCCEKEITEALPANSGITKSSCIPNDLLVEINGGELPLTRDRGQRIKQGCGCGVSVDVGSYRFHPCYHNCLFCYANPASGILLAHGGDP